MNRTKQNTYTTSADLAGERRAGRPRRPSLLQRLFPQSAQVRTAVRAILFLFVVFGLLLLNQARIARIVYQNAKLESQIRFTRMESAQKREQIQKSADIARIRKKAEMLGMTLPLEGQVLTINVARQDYVSFNSKRSQDSVLKDIDWRRALENVGRHLRLLEGMAPTEIISAENNVNKEKVIDGNTSPAGSEPVKKMETNSKSGDAATATEVKAHEQ